MRALLLLVVTSAIASADPAARTLSGTIVSPDGKPVRAEVFYTVDFWDPDSQAVAERFPDGTYDSGADGRFVIPRGGYTRPGVKLLRLRGVAHARGFSSSNEVVSAPEGAAGYVPPVLRLRPAVTVKIVVVDSETQNPVAGATVMPPRFGDPVDVGADGAAAFAGRDDRSGDEFEVTANGYERGGTTPDFTKPVQQVALRRLWPLMIRIAGLDGKPIAGCRVTIGSVERMTDRAGQLMVMAPHGDVSIAPSCRQNLDAPAFVHHVGTQIQELRLRPNGLYSGRVVDAHGNPIAHVTVAVRLENEISLSRPAASATATTDAQGMFQLSSFSANRFMIAVEDPRFTSASQLVVTMPSNPPLVLVATPL